jgi:hypothetical protein
MLSIPAKLLYLLLALAANQQGLSTFGDDRICLELGLSPDELQLGRAELQRLDLMAYDGHIYQLLALPSTPWLSSVKPSPPPLPSPLSMPDARLSTSEHGPVYTESMPEDVKHILRSLLGINQR